MQEIVAGARKYLAKRVVNLSGQSFSISQANYVLRDEAGTELDSGAANIAEDVVFILFNSSDFPADKIYSVVFSVEIDNSPKKLVEPIFFKIKQK